MLLEYLLLDFTSALSPSSSISGAQLLFSLENSRYSRPLHAIGTGEAASAGRGDKHCASKIAVQCTVCELVNSSHEVDKYFYSKTTLQRRAKRADSTRGPGS
jgi:hypothetical protein